jgi:hypothetical protein
MIMCILIKLGNYYREYQNFSQMGLRLLKKHKLWFHKGLAFLFFIKVYKIYTYQNHPDKKNKLMLQITEFKEQKGTNVIQHKGKYILKYKCELQKHFDIIPVYLFLHKLQL